MIGDNLISGITGEVPAELITDTEAHTPGAGRVFFELHVLEDVTLTAIAPAFTGNPVAGVVFAAGTVLKGRFTSVTLAGGKCVAYRG